jgi:hypothetical protein
MKSSMLGRKFGLLTVIEPISEKLRGCSSWLCACDCGGFRKAPGKYLRRGEIKSCGCLVKRRLSPAPPKHPRIPDTLVRTRTKQAWRSMRARCENPKSRKYSWYRSRGITVCEHWKKFENFLADMGDVPPNLELDRIDNDRGYEPGNCRWATRIQQQRNKSTNHLLTYEGETKCIAEWCEKYDLKRGAVEYRASRYDNPHWILFVKPKEAP